jgi:phenylacetate-coenzyme A ligase PaaK-like adenylate-forming protein
MPDAADARLLRHMADAASHVQLYRRLWAATGVVPDPGKAARLDKARLRACPLAERVHSDRQGRVLASELSSGSSGEPLTTYSDRRALIARRLAFLRALVACGYRPGSRILLLTSRRGAKPGFGLFGWHYASIAEGTGTLVKRAARISPRILYGPLSTLELMAERFARQRARLPHLRVVISTAEQLTPARQRLLEQAFGAPVADFYGMSEFGLVAYRRPGDREFRPARPSLILEFVPMQADDTLEQLVLTDLAERTAPLIRYDTGDCVRRDGAQPHRPIVEFAGRVFDCLLLPNGERVSPYRVDVVLERLPNLRAFEVVQQPDLSVDVTIEAAAEVAEELRAAAADRLASLLGPAIPLRVAAGTIPRARSGGKFRPIRSLAVARA